MPDLLSKYDDLLKENGPAAIILKQWLKPVGDPVIFPPTYANPSQRKGDPPVYNIDRFSDAEHGRQHSVCVIDSIPSQANRIEPVFGSLIDSEGTAVKLVPLARVQAEVSGKNVEIDLLDAGHRAADAVVRMSSKATDLRNASRSRLLGDSLPLAKAAPTSLVFGMWDSRETGVKVPRLINSIIRAYGVLEHRRSSQFNPAIDFEGAGVLREQKDKKLSEVGMDGAPATFQHGGIEAIGGICRDAAVNLCTLRDILSKSRPKANSKPSEAEFEVLIDSKEIKAATQQLQRYILGLALVAITYFDGKTLNLRQGCQLVNDPAKPIKRVLVSSDGTEAPFEVDRDGAIAYAAAAATAFGVGADWTVAFDVKAAKATLKKNKNEQEQEPDKP